MQEVPFTLPVSGILRIDSGEVTIVVNRTEISLNFDVQAKPPRRILLDEGATLNDIVLEAAKEIVAEKGYNRFHAAELYHASLQKHPGIKRNSFMARVVACTPDHPSNKYFGSRRDYFLYGGKGILILKEQYMPDRNNVNVPYKS